MVARPVFLPITWSEQCIFFPDGKRHTHDEAGRFKQRGNQMRIKLLQDGAAAHALKHGRSGSSRWRMSYISFDPHACRLKWEDGSHKGGTIDLAPAGVALFVSRLDARHLGLTFGGSRLLLMDTADLAVAKEWAVGLSSALFFRSDAFSAVSDECLQCFAAALSLRSGSRRPAALQLGGARLSAREVTLLLQTMLRPLSGSDMVALEQRLSEPGGLGPQGFTALYRHLASHDDPVDALARALALVGDSRSKGEPPNNCLGAALVVLRRFRLPDHAIDRLVETANRAAANSSEPVTPVHVASTLYPRLAAFLDRSDEGAFALEGSPLRAVSDVLLHSSAIEGPVTAQRQLP